MAEWGRVGDCMRPISKFFNVIIKERLGNTEDFLLTRKRQRMSAQSVMY